MPHTYRRHLPEFLKSRSSHDIVLLCVKCHQLASFHADSLRARLAVGDAAADAVDQIRALTFQIGAGQIQHLAIDPQEWTNLAGDPSLRAVMKRLDALMPPLPAG